MYGPDNDSTDFIKIQKKYDLADLLKGQKAKNNDLNKPKMKVSLLNNMQALSKNFIISKETILNYPFYRVNRDYKPFTPNITLWNITEKDR